MVGLSISSWISERASSGLVEYFLIYTSSCLIVEGRVEMGGGEQSRECESWCFEEYDKRSMRRGTTKRSLLTGV